MKYEITKQIDGGYQGVNTGDVYELLETYSHGVELLVGELPLFFYNEEVKQVNK